MRVFTLIVITTLTVQSAWADDKNRLATEQESIAGFGIAFFPPNDWHRGKPDERLANVRNYDFDAAEIAKLMDNASATTRVAVYMKHEPRTVAGVIPTIDIDVRPNLAKDMDQFFEMVEYTQGVLDEYFDNVAKVQHVERTKVAGHDAASMVTEFDLESGGKTYRIRTIVYAIPRGDIFYQINLSDEVGGAHGALFEEFIAGFEIID